MLNLEDLPIKRSMSIDKEFLQNFERNIALKYEAGHIKGPIHLSDGNEDQLINIFTRISSEDFVFSAWRNHYHALLHGVPTEFLSSEIIAGRSMGIIYNAPNFYSSSIVGGIVPIALGTALGYKQISGNTKHVWCFIGDMTYESGLFWEAYKMSVNCELPLTFVVEDNGKSVTTDTSEAWGGKMSPLERVIYYKYRSKYPHHGTGKWVNF